MNPKEIRKADPFIYLFFLLVTRVWYFFFIDWNADWCKFFEVSIFLGTKFKSFSFQKRNALQIASAGGFKNIVELLLTSKPTDLESKSIVKDSCFVF